jgi:hypothetical protein
MKCQNDALFIKDDHEHYVRCGQAEAIAHLTAGETAAGALSTHSVLAGPPIGFFI